METCPLPLLFQANMPHSTHCTLASSDKANYLQYTIFNTHNLILLSYLSPMFCQHFTLLLSVQTTDHPSSSFNKLSSLPKVEIQNFKVFTQCAPQFFIMVNLGCLLKIVLVSFSSYLRGCSTYNNHACITKLSCMFFSQKIFYWCDTHAIATCCFSITTTSRKAT